MTTGNPTSLQEDHTQHRAEALDRALRRLAQREEAPPELDRLLEPLRLQDFQPPMVRPVFRWAALAAAVLAGAFWLPALVPTGLTPQHGEPAARAEHRSGHHYQLQPLPGGEPGEQPETAAEAFQRLEPAAQLPTPLPLEVMGPTEADPTGEPYPRRPVRLTVAGRAYELPVPADLELTPMELVLEVSKGRITSASTRGGGPLPPGLLEALAPLGLQNVPDGRVPARLSPR